MAERSDREKRERWESEGGAAGRNRGSWGAGKDGIADPGAATAPGGGVFDVWYLDDGDTLTTPELVMPYIEALDAANVKMGAERSKTKTEVIFFMGREELDAKEVEWDLAAIRGEAEIRTADEGVLTLGVVTGPREKVEEQIRTKAKVLGQIHKQVEVVDDAQIEHIMAKESLGIARINHILRVHGSALKEGDSLNVMDEAARKT